MSETLILSFTWKLFKVYSTWALAASTHTDNWRYVSCVHISSYSHLNLESQVGSDSQAPKFSASLTFLIEYSQGDPFYLDTAVMDYGAHQIFSGKEDNYGGVVVNLIETEPMTAQEFESKLDVSLTAWKVQVLEDTRQTLSCLVSFSVLLTLGHDL